MTWTPPTDRHHFVCCPKCGLPLTVAATAAGDVPKCICCDYPTLADPCPHDRR